MDQPPAAGHDDVLLADLGRVIAAAEPVPEFLREAARAAFAWRNIDDELAQIVSLAELIYDSAEDARPLAGVRGTTTLRTLSFEGAGVGLELDVDGFHVEGQVVPASAATIEIHTTAGTVSATTDANGMFRVDLPSAGPAAIRVRLSGDDTPVLRTDWIRL